MSAFSSQRGRLLTANTGENMSALFKLVLEVIRVRVFGETVFQSCFGAQRRQPLWGVHDHSSHKNKGMMSSSSHQNWFGDGNVGLVQTTALKNKKYWKTTKLDAPFILTQCMFRRTWASYFWVSGIPFLCLHVTVRYWDMPLPVLFSNWFCFLENPK